MRAVLYMLLAHLVISLDAGIAWTAGSHVVTMTPDDVKLDIEQARSPIFPYQAIRLQFTVTNISGKRLGPLAQLGAGCEFAIKSPGSDIFLSPFGCILTNESGRPLMISPKETLDERFPLFLEPGQKTSLSFAFAASWQLADGNLLPKDQGSPVFGESGTYLIKCNYSPRLAGSDESQLSETEKRFIEKTVEIKVSVPDGDDKVIYELLRKDQQLASALMRPVDAPGQAEVAKLKQLVEKYPKSSYVSYAHFALARAYSHGIGVMIPSRRVAMALAGDSLESVVKHDYDPHTKNVTADNFPFRPNALILQAQVDPFERPHAFLYLHREHRESLEWIETFAGLLLSLSESDQAAMEVQRLIGQTCLSDSKVIKSFQESAWRDFRHLGDATGPAAESGQGPTPEPQETGRANAESSLASDKPKASNAYNRLILFGACAVLGGLGVLLSILFLRKGRFLTRQR